MRLLVCTPCHILCAVELVRELVRILQKKARREFSTFRLIEALQMLSKLAAKDENKKRIGEQPAQVISLCMGIVCSTHRKSVHSSLSHAQVISLLLKILLSDIVHTALQVIIDDDRHRTAFLGVTNIEV
jgi:hypothetical protein